MIFIQIKNLILSSSNSHKKTLPRVWQKFSKNSFSTLSIKSNSCMMISMSYCLVKTNWNNINILCPIKSLLIIYTRNYGHSRKVIEAITKNEACSTAKAVDSITSTSSSNISCKVSNTNVEPELKSCRILPNLGTKTTENKGLLSSISFKRDLVRNNTTTPLTKSMVYPSTPQQRYYPGHGYRTVMHKSKTSDVKTSTNKDLPQHETTHINVVDNETGLSVGVYSSCKDANKGFVKVASENYAGDKTNNNNPNSPSKAQYFKAYDNPRYINEQDYQHHTEAQIFTNKYEKEMDNIVSNANKQPKIPIKRVHKDSPELYHENGLPIYDSKGNEIDYD